MFSLSSDTSHLGKTSKNIHVVQQRESVPHEGPWGALVGGSGGELWVYAGHV